MSQHVSVKHVKMTRCPKVQTKALHRYTTYTLGEAREDTRPIERAPTPLNSNIALLYVHLTLKLFLIRSNIVQYISFQIKDVHHFPLVQLLALSKKS